MQFFGFGRYASWLQAEFSAIHTATPAGQLLFVEFSSASSALKQLAPKRNHAIGTDEHRVDQHVIARAPTLPFHQRKPFS